MAAALITAVSLGLVVPRAFVPPQRVLLQTVTSPATHSTDHQVLEYPERNDERALVLAAVRMGAVRGLSDVLCQAVQTTTTADMGHVDLSHVAAMSASGVLLSGAGGVLWVRASYLALHAFGTLSETHIAPIVSCGTQLRQLERSIGPSAGLSTVLQKSLLDFVCWSPAVISANMLLVSALMVRVAVVRTPAAPLVTRVGDTTRYGRAALSSEPLSHTNATHASR